MRLTTKGRYAVRAMVDLALRKTQVPVAIKSISKKENISQHYLEQLFIRLKKAGLVRSVRGPTGGYVLNKPPNEITIGDILRVVESSVTPSYCTDGDQTKDCCGQEKCVVKSLWQRLEEVVRDFLDSNTLEDICQEAQSVQEKDQPDHNFIFNI